MLGPALFLFYINHLPDALNSNVRLFAEGTVLYNSALNHNTLQDDLNCLEKWESDWDMEFHPKKCQHITLTRKQKPDHHTILLHNTEISKANSVKYLGVTLNPKLTWKDRINNITNKGNSALGFIRRNITTNSTEIKCTAYKQIVRPLLGYTSGSWDSLTKTPKEELEAVQRRAARLIYNIKRTDYKTSTTDLLSALQLDKLSERRSHSRLKLFGQYHFNVEGRDHQKLPPKNLPGF